LLASPSDDEKSCTAGRGRGKVVRSRRALTPSQFLPCKRRVGSRKSCSKAPRTLQKERQTKTARRNRTGCKARGSRRRSHRRPLRSLEHSESEMRDDEANKLALICISHLMYPRIVVVELLNVQLIVQRADARGVVVLLSSFSRVRTAEPQVIFLLKLRQQKLLSALDELK
jgi:hypothetical protein